MKEIINEEAAEVRRDLIAYISESKGDFFTNFSMLEKKLKKQISQRGKEALINHLRLCGTIPESYAHDTSQEKLYSKYTDSLLSFAYEAMGMKSSVVEGRVDMADVNVSAKGYEFVADAKAFRLSRTAKNQKDFKIQAMDHWKYGRSYAMVVCPIYQLPKRVSQIYQQATTRNVCIFTYSHLSLLVNYAEAEGKRKAEMLLLKVFKAVDASNPTKNAIDYWQTVNKTILGRSKIIRDLWRIEKMASLESVKIAKAEGLEHLANERNKILRMSHKQALKELINISKIDNKIRMIEAISDNGLFDVI